MDKQMFMIEIFWVYDPVGCFINFLWLLQTKEVLRVFVFTIFCELIIPTLGGIMLATQRSVEEWRMLGIWFCLVLRIHYWQIPYALCMCDMIFVLTRGQLIQMLGIFCKLINECAFEEKKYCIWQDYSQFSKVMLSLLNLNWLFK